MGDDVASDEAIASLVERAANRDAAAQSAIDIALDAAIARRDFGEADRYLRPLAVAACEEQPGLEFLLGLLVNHRIVDATVAKHVKDDRLREEAAQDALLSIARNLSQYEGRSRFTTWVYPIAANAGRMATRAAGRRPQAATDDLPELDPGLRHMSSIVVSRDQIRNAVAGLADHYRQPFELREYQGMSYEAIAAELDVSIGTVKSRIARARQEVADKLMGA